MPNWCYHLLRYSFVGLKSNYRAFWLRNSSVFCSINWNACVDIIYNYLHGFVFYYCPILGWNVSLNSSLYNDEFLECFYRPMVSTWIAWCCWRFPIDRTNVLWFLVHFSLAFITKIWTPLNNIRLTIFKFPISNK